MSKSEAEDPLLAQAMDTASQSSWSAALKKRKYRRCKSVPAQDMNHPEQYGVSIHQHPVSIFANQLDLKQILVFLAAYLGVGAFCFFLVRDQIVGSKTNGLVDAIYFCVVTMTTVGYGDLVPDSVAAKLLACTFVFIGMALVGFLLSKAADYIVEKQEIIMVKAMHMHDKCTSVEILRDVESNKAKYKVMTALVFLLMLMTAGILFLYLREGLDLFDAFYCVCATITTLGYGDKSFSTSGGRVFAALWILMSTICLAQFFCSLAELYTERRRKFLINWIISRKLTVSDLEAADLDNDKVVSVAEFVVYKLQEMGKISEEDVAVVMRGFKSLDIDQSGTLTKADLLNPESSSS